MSQQTDKQGILQVSFDYDFTNDKCVYFSFCFPWSYTKNNKFLEYLENKVINTNLTNKEIYFNREILILSKEKRRVDLITISSFTNMTNTKELLLKNLFPANIKDQTNRPYVFSKDKPIIFITARVHPGESQSSYVLNGMLKFLTDVNDPRSKIIRDNFVIKIVPMINVDGVSRGFYRYDTNSLNMNRHYPNPNAKIQPEISAIKRIFLFYAQDFNARYYFDLHGAASSFKGLFLFGNSLDFLPQVENCLYPKILEINSEFLDYENCNFEEKSMKTRDKGDQFSKEGTGRVHFNKCTSIIHSYTVEASYFKGAKINNLSQISTEGDFLENKNIFNQDSLKYYLPSTYQKMGISILVSILDYEEINPYSRIVNTEFKNVGEIRKFISNKLVKENDKFKFNLIYQNLCKDINNLKRFIPLNDKINISKKTTSTFYENKIKKSLITTAKNRFPIIEYNKNISQMNNTKQFSQVNKKLENIPNYLNKKSLSNVKASGNFLSNTIPIDLIDDKMKLNKFQINSALLVEDKTEKDEKIKLLIIDKMNRIGSNKFKINNSDCQKVNKNIRYFPVII